MVARQQRLDTAYAPGRAGVPAVAGVAVAAWALLIAGQAVGLEGVLSHDEILEYGTRPLPTAILIFVLAWQVMIGAMMLPTALPAVGAFSRLAGGRPRPRAGLAVFLGAYFAVWTGFGLAALSFDAGLHALTDTWGWLGDRPFLIAPAVFLLAAVYQFLPVKRRCLAACREPALLLADCRAGEGAWRSGLRHALACLGSNWPLMLVMFAVGTHALWWIGLLTLVLVAEKVLPGWRWTVPGVGVGFGCAGVAVALL